MVMNNQIECGLNLRRGTVPIDTAPHQSDAVEPAADTVESRLAELTPEQRERLDRSIESDSEAFFKLMQTAVKKINETLATAYTEHGADLPLLAVTEMLTTQGVEQPDALEAAKTIVAAAKQAKSGEQFTDVLTEQFDPNSRLLLTMKHWRDRSPHSWYMATPAGQGRLEELLGRLE
jgi:hypothetical protein